MNWALHIALPRLAQLTGATHRWEAWRLARQIEPILGQDATVQKFYNNFGMNRVAIHTAPEGAKVLMRDYLPDDAPWTSLGTTPIDNVPLPESAARLRFTRTVTTRSKPGTWTCHAMCDTR